MRKKITVASTLTLLVGAAVVGCVTPPEPLHPAAPGFTKIVSDPTSSEYVFCRGCDDAAPTKKTAVAPVIIDPQLLKEAIIASVKPKQEKKPETPALTPEQSAIAYSRKQIEEVGLTLKMSALSPDSIRKMQTRIRAMEKQVASNSTALITVEFKAASKEFEPPAETEKVLVPAAKVANHITVRGFTDANSINKNGTDIAIGRAMAARKYLVAQGVDRKKIQTRYISSGGFIADNQTPQGKAINRRVEITLQFPKSSFQP